MSVLDRQPPWKGSDMAASAMQTVAANDFTLTHGNKEALHIIIAGSGDTWTSDGTTAIADGKVRGQKLLLLISGNGASNFLVLKDNANTLLQGDCKFGFVEQAMLLEWTGASWLEVFRKTGVNNTPTGDRSAAVGGLDNTPTGVASASVGGNGNTPAGFYSVSVGGATNTPTGSYSSTVGSQQADAPLRGQYSQAAGQFAAGGDAQATRLVARMVVTHDDADWHDLFLDGIDDLILIPVNSAWHFEILLVGTTQGCAKTFAYKIVGLIENDGGSTSILASTVTDVYEGDDADFDAQVVADDTNDALIIQVSDSTSGSDVVRWVASIDAVCVTFPA